MPPKWIEDLWAGETNIDETRHAYELLQRDSARAVVRLAALANSGSLMSMVYLGHAYATGKAPTVDQAEAEYWFRRASDGGSLLGLYFLGKLQFSQNRYSEAQKAFEVSANGGNPLAMATLGRMYLNGVGLPKDVHAAKKLLTSAAGQGHLIAKSDLSLSFLRGDFGNFSRLKGMWLRLTVILDALRIAIFASQKGKRLLTKDELMSEILGY